MGEKTSSSLADLLAHAPSTLRIAGEDASFDRDSFLSMCEAFSAAYRDVRLTRGDPVGILLPNSARTAAAYFGAWREGLAVVPVSLALSRDDQRYILERSEVRVLVACEGLKETAAELEPTLGETGRVVWTERVPEAPASSSPAPFIHPEDLAAIFFTSGTTGRPKGVMLSHRAMLADAQACRAAFRFGPQDAFTTAIPLFHCFSTTVCLLLPVLAGGRTRLVSPARFARALGEDAGTVVGVPSQLASLLTQSCEPNGLVRFLSGGAALPPQARAGLGARFGVPVYEGYGTTECAPVVSVQRPGAEGPSEAVGRPLEGVAVEIRDESGRALPAGDVGEIAVGGKILMSGYYDLATVTTKRIRGGFFHTGDLGFIDRDGYLHIVDRVVDTILRHGLTIYPHEIEEILASHPEVKEAAVLGLPDGAGNEVPFAVCVPSATPARANLAKELVEYASRRLPIYKVPIRVEFRDDLPKTATGKVVKRALRQKWA